MDYSKMSPIEIARDIVDLAKHTAVARQPVPRSPWGAATALGALPVARALVELDAALDARRAEYMDENRDLQARINELELVDIVFDGPPSHESGRFVEVEDQSGKSIRVGEWLQKGDYWVLQLTVRRDPTKGPTP